MLNEMLALFLSSRKRGVDGAKKKCKPNSVAIYTSNLKIFFDFLQCEVGDGGIVKYASIRRIHLTQFLDWMDAKQAAGTWSRSTILQILRSLRAFFRWVEKDEDCQAQELKSLHRYLPSIERTPRRMDIPESGDLRKFKNAFDTEDKWGYRDFVAVSLMMTNGIRIGELCNLKVDGVHADDKTLIVSGKTGTRLVPITEEMVKLLKGWMKRRTLCKYAADSEYVFVSKKSPRMGPAAFAQRFIIHRRKHGMARISAHTFRHAFCTNYLAKGGNINRLKDISGHSSFAMLLDYLHESKLGTKATQDELEKVNMLKE